ncbi:MAG: hypothetical protein C3L25_04075 [Candidatus Sedimenticola endophacoides]|uniref:Glutaredoxin domain-containing protein n=1 Tax=Candidatus Sedimenticola endophacoides TaxID=2548426 RepID=A0A6N4DJ23_9GAMM|nr:MAG: hypothetical protein C3L24_10095 [Candidatus Sedimenticola endophacoides]PUE01137.1 MAG: hypothetical protein C3L26_04085 [Candidatus Sedimenticola endophacoides]PUE04507.1 MAG: hypothetical protein C3L25_04075 [Candidatus Sedimenticola endophacoides]
MASEPLQLRINTIDTVEVAPPDATGDGGVARTDPARVVLYGAAWCGVCERAKRYFRARRIPFTEYDVEKSAKGRRDYRRLGGRGVPIILVGKRRMDGFSEEHFATLYRR